MGTFNNASSVYHNNKEVSSIVDLGNHKVIWEKNSPTTTLIVEPVIFNIDFGNVEEDILNNGCGVNFCLNENGALLNDYTEEEYQSLLNTEREEYEDYVTSLFYLGKFYENDLYQESFYLEGGAGEMGTIENGIATIELDLETTYGGIVIFAIYEDYPNETKIFPQHTVTHTSNNTIVNVVI